MFTKALTLILTIFLTASILLTQTAPLPPPTITKTATLGTHNVVRPSVFPVPDTVSIGTHVVASLPHLPIPPNVNVERSPVSPVPDHHVRLPRADDTAPLPWLPIPPTVERSPVFAVPDFHARAEDEGENDIAPNHGPTYMPPTAVHPRALPVMTLGVKRLIGVKSLASAPSTVPVLPTGSHDWGLTPTRLPSEAELWSAFREATSLASETIVVVPTPTKVPVSDGELGARDIPTRVPLPSIKLGGRGMPTRVPLLPSIKFGGRDMPTRVPLLPSIKLGGRDMPTRVPLPSIKLAGNKRTATVDLGDLDDSVIFVNSPPPYVPLGHGPVVVSTSTSRVPTRVPIPVTVSTATVDLSSLDDSIIFVNSAPGDGVPGVPLGHGPVVISTSSSTARVPTRVPIPLPHSVPTTLVTVTASPSPSAGSRLGKRGGPGGSGYNPTPSALLPKSSSTSTSETPTPTPTACVTKVEARGAPYHGYEPPKTEEDECEDEPAIEARGGPGGSGYNPTPLNLRPKSSSTSTLTATPTPTACVTKVEARGAPYHGYEAPKAEESEAPQC